MEYLPPILKSSFDVGPAVETGPERSGGGVISLVPFIVHPPHSIGKLVSLTLYLLRIPHMPGITHTVYIKGCISLITPPPDRSGPVSTAGPTSKEDFQIGGKNSIFGMCTAESADFERIAPVLTQS